MCEAHDISRRFRRIINRDAQNWTRKVSASSNGHNFWFVYMCEAQYISRRSKINNRGSRENQTVITFHSDVRFRQILYWDAQNWTRKLLPNSTGHNFWLGCICEAHDISRCSKMYNGSSRQIQMIITFHSDVRFRRIIYPDALNWTRKVLTNSTALPFWLGCMCEAHDISRRSKMNNEDSWEIQRVITFHSDVRLRRIIYPDARNWTQKVSANSNGHNFWFMCMC